MKLKNITSAREKTLFSSDIFDTSQYIQTLGKRKSGNPGKSLVNTLDPRASFATEWR